MMTSKIRSCGSRTPTQRIPGAISAVRTRLHRLEHRLLGSAVRAGPIVRDALEGRAGGYAVVGVALGGVVDIAADRALVLLHGLSPCLPSWVLAGSCPRMTFGR